MPTKKPQLLLTFPDADLLKRIEDFRFKKRISSRSDAIRLLIERGLQASNRKKARKA